MHSVLYLIKHKQMTKTELKLKQAEIQYAPLNSKLQSKQFCVLSLSGSHITQNTLLTYLFGMKLKLSPEENTHFPVCSFKVKELGSKKKKKRHFKECLKEKKKSMLHTGH